MDNRNENYKEIILAEAKEIAINEGISKINIRTVAKNSGIAIGTIYNYFHSKGDLLIAVIEDFWKGAFKEIGLTSFSNGDFYQNLEIIYNILYIYISKLKESWLEQLSLLKSKEKLLGKQKEKEYLEKIHHIILRLMDMDNNLKAYPWCHIITKEKMTEFIFDNMLIMLKKGEEDIGFFIEILKRI
ncbi:putative transcription regulator [[Clostridium] ultunense Esp]|uniref:Putative transcription regulator n=1 Tax=[Clostridium] ultunense Esp TaxID=1288971 RepID=M1YX30_9FIRM|nr:TetR/AcrR family transcriptional regulator [Schnuerera ultunensis]CCQ95145.1 putative transcription regulator [[Clostridium] ultunense Esp]SHD77837.1 putative transcription regulator [[Clostridium] ultunense Esp]